MSGGKYRSILFFLLIVVVGIVFWGYKESQDRVKDNHIVLCGEIEIIVSGRGGNWLVTYSFEYGGKFYRRGSVFCNRETYERYEEGQKNILVAFEKDNFTNSSLIETSEDFKKFDIKASDTVGLKCW